MRSYTIIGPGSIGMYVSCLLIRSDRNVCIIDYRAERARELNKDGICLIEEGEKECFNINVHSDIRNVDSKDICLVCVKSYSFDNVISQWGEGLRAFNAVVFLQNGINWLNIPEYYKHECAAGGGLAYFGATTMRRGVVRSGGTGTLYIGSLLAERDRLYKEISEDISAAGIECLADGNIRHRVWEKLIVNMAINPLTVLYECRNGALLDNGERESLLEDITAEGTEAAQSEGIPLEKKDMGKRVKQTCRKTAQNISSMLQDFRGGRRTELDAIVGEVINIASRHGLEPERSREVYEQVKGKLT